MHNFDTPIAGYNHKTIPEQNYDREWNNNERENEQEFEDEQQYEEEYESGPEERETVSGEMEQDELAGELLNVQSEDELDRVVHKAMRRSSQHGIDRQVALALAMLLKGFAKKLFRRAGRKPLSNRHRGFHSFDLNSEVPGNEAQELNGEDQEFENRRSFIRMAGHAARYASRLPQNRSAAWRARRAMATAVRRHAPGSWQQGFSNPFSTGIARRLDALEHTIRTLTEQLEQQNALPAPQGAPGEMEYENGNEEYESYEHEEEFEDESYAPEGEYESGSYEAEQFENENEVTGECECESCNSKRRKRRRATDSEDESYEYEDEYEYEREDEYENEFESESEDHESTFHESAQMELASELLSVQNEDELDQFLGKLIKKAARFAGKLVKGPLTGMLKSVAKVALPIAGNIIAPGVGGQVGKAASNLFELEMEGMSAEDREFENAKAFVRFAGNAARRAAANRRPVNPRQNARRAMTRAAKRYAPALVRRRQQQLNRQRVLNRRRQPAQRYANRRHPQRANTAYRYNTPRHAGQPYYPDANQPLQDTNTFGNDAPLLTQRLTGLEDALRLLSERISLMGPVNNQPVDGGNGDVNTPTDSEYWN